jgi:hypothetical protein
MMEDALTHWDSEAPTMDAQVEEIEHFDARGMCCVYGRGDHFGRHRSFNMDIWKTRDERLMMRCWSRCEDIDWRSFEIKGIDTDKIPEGDTKRQAFGNHGFRRLHARLTTSGSKKNSEQGRRPTMSLQARLFTQCRETQ